MGSFNYKKWVAENKHGKTYAESVYGGSNSPKINEQEAIDLWGGNSIQISDLNPLEYYACGPCVAGSTDPYGNDITGDYACNPGFSNISLTSDQINLSNIYSYPSDPTTVLAWDLSTLTSDEVVGGWESIEGLPEEFAVVTEPEQTYGGWQYPNILYLITNPQLGDGMGSGLFEHCASGSSTLEGGDDGAVGGEGGEEEETVEEITCYQCVSDLPEALINQLSDMGYGPNDVLEGPSADPEYGAEEDDCMFYVELQYPTGEPYQSIMGGGTTSLETANANCGIGDDTGEEETGIMMNVWGCTPSGIGVEIVGQVEDFPGSSITMTCPCNSSPNSVCGDNGWVCDEIGYQGSHFAIKNIDDENPNLGILENNICIGPEPEGQPAPPAGKDIGGALAGELPGQARRKRLREIKNLIKSEIKKLKK